MCDRIWHALCNFISDKFTSDAAWQAAFDIEKSGNVTNELVKHEIVDLLMKAKNAEQKFLNYAGW